ncbi:MAG: segregation ATPase FtsK/SpoIIIE, family [Gaiellales bacterium]|nr:segregation ATPase FtsK/SpoIIIE, family [Gaiellales bacterium]
MASRRKTATARRAPARTSRPARKRPAAARRKQVREPLLSPHQYRDLAGLALGALAAFSVLVLWAGAGGGQVGGALKSGLELTAGRGVAVAPLALAALGASLLLRADPRRLRPFRVGAVALSLGLLSLLGSANLDHRSLRDGGGYAGNGVHAAAAAVAGEPGALVLAVFAVIAGLLLLSGASAYVLLGHSATAARRSAQGVVRVAATVRDVRMPADLPTAVRTRARRTATSAMPPLDLEQQFPDVFERDPEPETTFEPPLPVMPQLPAPFQPGDTQNEVTEAHDREEPPQESDAHEAVVPPAVSNYRLPDARVLQRGTRPTGKDVDVERVGASLLAALTEHGVEARLIGTVSGPRVTRYELQLAPGTKVSRVTALRDDLAYALATTEIRILAPIPGKQAVGVEVPNRSPNLVSLGDLVDEPATGSPLTVWLGKDISGQTVIADLARMPHLLIAGTTGSGKSGCINSMLCSILLRATPDEVRMILIDPKKVELNHYETIPHLLTPVVTNMKNAAAVLQNVVRQMEERYELMGLHKARNLPEMNRVRLRDGKPQLPYMLVVIDELADLMMVSPAEVEDAIIRLAQKSRAVGIHLLLATQRPSVDVITGMIKANVPSRIAFAVSSQTDSRVILDTAGAEALLGSGDMLYKPLGTSRLQRVQGGYISEEEIALLVQQCRMQAEPEFSEELLETAPDVESEELDPDEDDLLDDAILCVAQHETASVSLLQRRLRVGYTRAGRLVDMLERRGVISGYEGSKPRRVLVTYDEAQRMVGRTPIEG